MTINHSEFHKVQLDENREMIDGKLIKSSIMIHIRCDEPDELIRLYQQVKEKLNGKGQEEIPEIEGDKKDVPYCDCGLPMALRKNKKKNSWFWSCQRWTPQGGGCGMTKPYSEAKEEVPVIEE